MSRPTPASPALNVLAYQRCRCCPAAVELRPYEGGALPPRWYDADTDHPHTCH